MPDTITISPIISLQTVQVFDTNTTGTVNIIASSQPQTIEFFSTVQNNLLEVLAPVTEQKVIEVGYQQGAAGRDGTNGINGVGIQGLTGKTGQTGQTGAPGSTYIHYQSVPAKIWYVNHNLNSYPPVSIINSAGELVGADIKYTDSNNLIILFGGANSGIASV